MTENRNPFIRLGDDGGDAPRLRYNIPESTNFVGKSVISVDVDPDMLNAATRKLIEQNRKDKEQPTPKPPSVPKPVITNKLVMATRSGTDPMFRFGKIATFTSKEALAEATKEIPIANFILIPKENLYGFGVGYDLVAPRPKPAGKIFPKILFYDRLQISTFLGNYGAGRVIKTFSLFPGEKTTISVKSYKKTSTKESTKINEGSSILDSITEEASTDFENSVQSEFSSKFDESSADILNSESSSSSGEGSGGAKVLWGLVEAQGSGASAQQSSREGEWGTRSAREEVAKNVSSALFKHSARSSAKRNVEVNTSSEELVETSTETSNERSIVREIENINKSRTLNMVFRQMVQEFVSVVHLTDVSFALYDESPGPYPTYTVRELDRFLDDYFADNKKVRSEIKNRILRELYYVFNYQDNPKAFLEKVDLEFPQELVDENNADFSDSVEYWRIRKNLKDHVEGSEFMEVDGIALSVNRITMRTEGVVVDAFLGEGDALDDYAQAIQAQTVQKLILENEELAAGTKKIQLRNNILEEGDSERADLHAKLYNCCPKDSTVPVVAESAENEPEG